MFGTMPMPEPTKATNLDATTTWCRTCDFAVSMPHEHPITVPFAAVVNGVTPTKPTPTVIVTDRDLTLARRWYRCGCGAMHNDPHGESTDVHVVENVERMAAEIAAAREIGRASGRERVE